MRIKIYNLSINELFELIDESVNQDRKITLSYINQYVFLQIVKNKNLKNYYYDSVNLIDGIGIYLYLVISNLGKNYKIIRNVSTDIWNKLLSHSREKNYSTVLWGGHNPSLNFQETNFKSKFLKIEIFTIIDGYNYSESDALKLINDVKPKILFIGLGTPKQEIFIRENLDKINANIIIPVGSAIDYFTGYKKRAPLWMRKIGLEWSFRLFQEPKRLWKRYILGIPLFIFYVLRQKVKLVLNKTEE